MDIPRTVTAALDDRPVSGARCLEAGAGVGNMTGGLLANDAARVYAVTNERDHAQTTRRRVGSNVTDRLSVIEADLRSIPLPNDSVDLITAHGLCNVLAPPALSAIVDELTRVAAPNCHLVIDDYDPLPPDATIRELFAIENATAELAIGRPALTFHPAESLRRLFEGWGWQFDRERTLLEPVPWTTNHVTAHADRVSSLGAELPDDMSEPLMAAANRFVTEIGSTSTGRMYSLALCFSD